MTEANSTAAVFPPGPFAVGNTGNGERGFIFNAAHDPTMRASKRFKLVGACSEKPEDMPWAMANYQLSAEQVTTSTRDMVGRILREYGDGAVFSVTTPTALHARFMKEAAEGGIKLMITDKPVCPTFADYAALAAALKGKGVSSCVTFNHNYMIPVLWLRALVNAKGTGSVETIATGFLQDWLMTDPKIQQSGWRLADPYGGLTDIGSHAGMLAHWIMGLPIDRLFEVIMGTAGAHGAKCFDNGTMKLAFSNGMVGTSRFHQALEGHKDDLYGVVTFKDGVLKGGWKHVMFRMEWGPDAIFLSKGDGNIDDWAQWQIYQAAECPFLKENLPKEAIDAVMNLRFNPPGHAEGWAEGWRRMWDAVAGYFWTQLGRGYTLEGPHALPAPTLETLGEHSMRFIGAAIKAQKTKGEVALADVA